MRIAVLGMHRSGTNVIGRWILRQSDLADRPLWLENEFDWIEDGLHEDGYKFISQVNHPGHKGWEAHTSANSVVTVERESFSYFYNFTYDYEYKPGQCVVVIRDFRNWIASVFKMNGGKILPELDIMKYRSHLHSIIHSDRWAKPIIYNLWCSSALYRKQVSDSLGLKFTDDGYKDVPANGGGSSFDGTWFDGAGNRMNTDKRYLEFKDNVDFKRMLAQYEEVVEMSDYWIAKV